MNDEENDKASENGQQSVKDLLAAFTLEPGDRVFRDDGSPDDIAELPPPPPPVKDDDGNVLPPSSWATEYPWWQVAGTYQRAADLLVEKALEDRYERDSAALPICYLYRHALEVHMKAVLVKNNGLFRRLRRVREAQERAGYDIDRQGDVGEVNPKNPGHDLMKLWDYIVGPVSDIDGSNGVDPVSGCIKEWHDYDKLSTTSRYPEKRDLRRVNLRNLKEVMEKLFAFFEGLSMQTDDARDGIDETMDYWARTGGPPKKQCP